jgi:hypothetical protein
MVADDTVALALEMRAMGAEKLSNDPKTDRDWIPHRFIPNCGTMEGQYSCWWCGRTIAEHEQKHDEVTGR